MELNYRIWDFFFWENDGQKEASYNKDFIKYYYTWLGYHDMLLQPKYWLILWRKWTWKSLLWEYFNSKNLNSEIISYRDFRYNELYKLEDWDVKPNQYSSIWKFILFLYLWKKILEDTSLNKNKEYKDLEEFIKRNFDFELDQNKILKLAIEKKIEWNIGLESSWLLSTMWLKWKASWWGEYTDSKELWSWDYLQYLNSLEKVIFKLISCSDKDFYIILDDLDDRFRRNDENKDAIISLIKTINSINIKIHKLWKKTKFIALLRTDIFYFLWDTDLNKIKVDNSIIINWQSNISKDSQLLHMLTHKLRVSQPEFKNLSHKEIFDLIFNENIIIFNNYTKREVIIEPYKFILERTFFRPRDIVSFINIIAKKFPNNKHISKDNLYLAERDYSEYLVQEIRDELSGHYDPILIQESFSLLKQFKKNQFKYSEIKDFLKNNENRFKEINNIDVILKIHFDFWILWNSWKNQWRPLYTSVIRDEWAEIDFNKDFVLNLWLRKAILF